MEDEEDEELFKTAYERFVEELDTISAKEGVTKYLYLDLGPDAFVDADICEMALVAAELLLRSKGEGIGEIPEEVETASRQWTFSYAKQDFSLAAETIAKLGQPGSELDLIMESEGEEGYQAWKEYLETLTTALTARAASV